jgi:hypothetical protein
LAVEFALPVGLFLGIISTWQIRLRTAAQEREMTHRIFASELRENLGYPTSETIQGLRLLKAFIRLSPSQRAEVVDLVEQLAHDPAPVPNGHLNTR